MALVDQRILKVHLHWFEKASRKQVSLDRYQCKEIREGLVEAQYNLAQMYHYGLGVNKNLSYAAMLYELAAKQGMKEAQFNIAQILHYGPSEMQNLQKAYRWYLKAANQNVLEAEFNLGLMHHYGRGTQQDYVLARQHYLKAVQADIAEADLKPRIFILLWLGRSY